MYAFPGAPGLFLNPPVLDRVDAPTAGEIPPGDAVGRKDLSLRREADVAPVAPWRARGHSHQLSRGIPRSLKRHATPGDYPLSD